MTNSHDSIPNEAEPVDDASAEFCQDDSLDSEDEVISVPDLDFEGEHFIIKVGPRIKKKRLDTYLQTRFGQFSRTHIQNLIKAQGVLVNDHPAKPSTKLSAGDMVDLVVPTVKDREIVGEDIPLDIIYEDDAMLVINKQAGIIVHPARGHKSGTLVNALIFYAKQLSSINGDFRPGIVHRLDRNTTGVMVVAKTDEAHLAMSNQFADRTTQKTYIAVVHGVPELDADRINKPIGTNISFRERMAVNFAGKEAVTFYKVLEKFRGYSVIELTPKTGRTHQLRVHMMHIRHSIVADDMYGGKVVYPWQIEDRPAAPEDTLLSRTALHAWRLEINHPTTKKRMVFLADLPDDIQNLIDNLREYRQILPKEEEAAQRVRPHDLPPE